MDGMVILAEMLGQIYHAGYKGTTRPNHFSSVLKMADKGLELSFGTPPIQSPMMGRIKESIHFVSRQMGQLVDRVKFVAQGNHASGRTHLLCRVKR